MKNFYGKSAWLILLCCLSFVIGRAQVSLSADASPSTVGLDEYVSYRIIIENAASIQQLTPPSFENFQLAGGPSQETGINNINGQVSRYIAVIFTLKPLKTGKFTIKGASAKIGDKLLKTEPVTITVTRQAQGNTATASPFQIFDQPLAPAAPAYGDYLLKKGENITEKVNRNMQLRLEVDKQSCYEGEPIIATYKLYTRLKSEARILQSPSFNGFSVVDIQQGEEGAQSTGTLNGREYNVYTIRKAQLYALQPGVIELEPAELENKIQFVKEEYKETGRASIGGFFDDYGMSFPPEAILNHTVNLSNKPVSITVKPLPEKDKPASFKGAVGNFSFEAWLAKDLFSTDESGSLFIRITGAGNMQLLTMPDITWPAGIESFDPVVTDKLDKLSVPVKGSKTFEIPFSVDNAGDYTIPAIAFSYFNPASGTYTTQTSKPLSFKVSKGTGATTDYAGTISKKNEMGFINKIFHHRWWIIVFIISLVVVGIIIWLRREKQVQAKTATLPIVIPQEEKIAAEVAETVISNQQQVFEKTEKCLQDNDCVQFYGLLNSELKSFLSAKFAMPAATNSTAAYIQAMDKAGVPNETILQLQNLISEIEWQLYTPFERSSKMNELYERAQELVYDIKGTTFRNR